MGVYHSDNIESERRLYENKNITESYPISFEV